MLYKVVKMKINEIKEVWVDITKRKVVFFGKNNKIKVNKCKTNESFNSWLQTIDLLVLGGALKLENIRLVK